MEYAKGKATTKAWSSPAEDPRWTIMLDGAIRFITAGYNDEANAKELVRRWNAFEEGGIVEELKVACDVGLDAMNALLEIDIKLNSKNKKSLKETIKFVEAALAKS